MTQTQPTNQDNARAIITQALQAWDLERLADWAWQRYKETNSIDLVMLEMEDRKEYQDRFAGRLALRELGFQMSEAEQLAWENQARATMRAAGMPESFYDSWQDFQPLISTGMSNVELADRVNDAFVAVTQAPPEVRQTFAEFYGPDSDSAIAALVLDADTALPLIQRQVAASEAGGFIRQQGYRITQSLAEAIALAGNPADFRQGAQKLGQIGASGLFGSLWGETNTATVDQAARAFLAHDSQAEWEMQRAMDTRAATSQGSEERSSEGYGTANRT